MTILLTNNYTNYQHLNATIPIISILAIHVNIEHFVSKLSLFSSHCWNQLNSPKKKKIQRVQQSKIYHTKRQLHDKIYKFIFHNPNTFFVFIITTYLCIHSTYGYETLQKPNIWHFRIKKTCFHILNYHA